MKWSVVTEISGAPSGWNGEHVVDFALLMKQQGASHIVFIVPNKDQAIFKDISALPEVKLVQKSQIDAQKLGFDEQNPEEAKAANFAFIRQKYKADWWIALDLREWLDCHGNISEILGRANAQIVALRPYERFELERSGQRGIADFNYRCALPETPQGDRVGHRLYGETFLESNRGLLGDGAPRYFVHKDAALEKADYLAIGEGSYEAEFSDEIYLLRHLYDDYYDWLRQTEQDGGQEARQFYEEINVYGKQKNRLKNWGVYHEQFLWLDDLRAELLGEGEAWFANQKRDPKTGKIEGQIDLDGLKMHLHPHGNYTELRLSRGEIPEHEELGIFEDLVKGNKVRFYDVGGNAGIYSLRVAQFADPKSKITAYEPNPIMAARFERNVKMNGFKSIKIKRAAVAEEAGEVNFAVDEHNLGMSRVVEEGETMTVPALRLLDELENPEKFDLSLLKVDVEGFEPAVFSSLFSVEPEKVYWPDFILVEQSHGEDWRDEVFANLEAVGFAPHYENRLNILWELKTPPTD